jgi:outer membrane protein TolC
VPRRRTLANLLLLLAAGGGCSSPEQYAAEADAEVLPMLAEADQAALGSRDSWVLQPEPEHPEEVGDTDEGASAEPGAETRRLDLQTSLQIAFDTGREFQNRKESLYLSGLGLSLVRYDFGPVLDATIAALWSDAEDNSSSTELVAGAGLSQILPQGGTFRLDGLLTATSFGGGVAPGEDDPRYDSRLAFGLSQPLLRGYGYEVSHEALTQAERDLVYAVREFELFREDYSIDIAQDYFDLVRQRKQLAILEQSRDDALFDRNQAEALFQVDRNQVEDVNLAKRRLISAETDLLQARADYEAARDAFKVRLGLPSEVQVVIVEAEPPFHRVDLDSDSAVRVALHNRLDLQSSADRLDDTERGVRLARNALLPDLQFDAVLGLEGSDGAVGSSMPDEWSATAGLSLALPVDRQAERNAWRSALIALDRARRDHELLLSNVERDVRDQLRQLRRTEQEIGLQTEQIAQEQRNVAVTQIRYESGDTDNRGLLEARQTLVNAQNELIDLQVQHFIARMRLMRSLGILFVDERGRWKE